MWILGKTKVSDFIRAAHSCSCVSMNNMVGGTGYWGAGMLQFAGRGGRVGVGWGGLLRIEKNNLPTRKKREAKLWAPGSEFFLVFFFKTLLTCQPQRTVNLCLLKTP